MTVNVSGIHHVSAITAQIERNHHFFTQILGLRLVKKTVNQDNTSSYHLFYADAVGTPGTDMTYFDIPGMGRTLPGVSSINSTAFRVTSEEALAYWVKRFDEHNIAHGDITERFGRKVLPFQDFEDARFLLVVDDGKGIPYGTPWTKTDVPEEFALVGLGGVTLTLAKPAATEKVLTQLYGFEKVGTYPSPVAGQPDIVVYSSGEGGPAGEVHIEERHDLPIERHGRGSVHHVAFRVKSVEEYEAMVAQYEELGLHTSGKIDRFYFKAVYYRDPNGILFEVSTDEPGFSSDEPLEHMGEELALPPFLEGHRESIEATLHPLELEE